MTRKIAIIRSATNDANQLARQKQAITETLEKQGLRASDVEWIVADQNTYPDLLNGLVSAGSDQIEALYVTEMTRLTREYRELVELIGALAIAGCKLYAVQLSEYDLLTQPWLLRILISPVGMVRS